VARGEVIGTSPEGGTSVRRGTTVTLIVSRGRERVAVPDVVGQTQADAEAALQNAGLAASVSQREDGTVAAGTVLAQDPAAGTSVALGRTVALVVATAPAAVPVPGVIDQAEDDAVAALEDAGFRVRVRATDADTPEEDGVVTDQNPDPDTAAAPGSRVTITVGRFEPPPQPDTTPTPSPTP
jgi:serine/threonine-protein kinase